MGRGSGLRPSNDLSPDRDNGYLKMVARCLRWLIWSGCEPRSTDTRPFHCGQLCSRPRLEIWVNSSFQALSQPSSSRAYFLTNESRASWTSSDCHHFWGLSRMPSTMSEAESADSCSTPTLFNSSTNGRAVSRKSCVLGSCRVRRPRNGR